MAVSLQDQTQASVSTPALPRAPRAWLPGQRSAQGLNTLNSAVSRWQASNGGIAIGESETGQTSSPLASKREGDGPGSPRGENAPRDLVSLGQSEVQHVACKPDWPGQSPSALGQLLLVRWMIPAEATGVKAAVQSTPQWVGMGVGEGWSSYSLLYKQPRNSPDFPFQPTEPKIFTIWAFIEKNIANLHFIYLFFTTWHVGSQFPPGKSQPHVR